MRRTSSKRFPLILSLALLAGLLVAPLAAAGPTQDSHPGQVRALMRADGTAERALFHARTETFQRCLWSTDGTPQGTFRLDVDGQCLTVSGQDGAVHAVADGVAYVLIGATPRRVWRTDGTAAGTWPLGQPFDHRPRWPDGFELLYSPALDLVFFLADDGMHGIEPWVSDGTPGGARLLADVVPPSEDGHAFHFQEVGGEVLFFRPRDGEHELWRSDGTPEGTRPVAPIADDDPETVPSRLVPVAGGAVFFLESFCRSDLWRTDGTAAGTTRLGSFGEEGVEHCGSRQGPDGAFSDAELPGLAFFSAAPPEGGRRVLWRTDGTPAGTVALTDPEETIFPSSRRETRPVAFAGHLYFQAWDALHGDELWRSDGSADGAELVADLCPGTCSGQPVNLHPIGDGLLFAAFDPELGWEPWTSDGTAAGTLRIGDLCPGRCSTWGGIDPGLVLGDSLLFGRFVSGQGHELSSLRLPEGPLLRLTDADPAPLVDAVALGGRALFAADDGVHGVEPWVSDGTPQGTHMLVDANTLSSLVVVPPVELTAEPLGGGRVRLHWRDEGDEESFGFMVTRADGEIVLTATAPANATSLDIELPEGTHTVRGFAFHPEVGRTEWSDQVVVQVGACEPGGRFLCLGSGRFRVSVDWIYPSMPPGRPYYGPGMPVATSVGGDDSGSFWFFTEDNVELIVKVLDGTSVNDHSWVFWGGLSNAGYSLHVEDTLTGQARTYHNPFLHLCGGSDTAAFPEPGVAGTARTSAAARDRGSSPAAVAPAQPGHFAAASGPATRFIAIDAPASVSGALHPPQPCVPDEETLCLLDGMLAVTVDWTDQHNGGSGVGHAVAHTEVTGFFWFFHPENVELVVKALDGRTVNGKIWVFYGALTDVGYTIRVENREDGHAVRTYENPPGVICGQGDTAAF